MRNFCTRISPILITSTRCFCFSFLFNKQFLVFVIYQKTNANLTDIEVFLLAFLELLNTVGMSTEMTALYHVKQARYCTQPSFFSLDDRRHDHHGQKGWSATNVYCNTVLLRRQNVLRGQMHTKATTVEIQHRACTEKCITDLNESNDKHTKLASRSEAIIEHPLIKATTQDTERYLFRSGTCQ